MRLVVLITAGPVLGKDAPYETHFATAFAAPLVALALALTFVFILCTFSSVTLLILILHHTSLLSNGAARAQEYIEEVNTASPRCPIREVELSPKSVTIEKDEEACADAIHDRDIVCQTIQESTDGESCEGPDKAVHARKIHRVSPAETGEDTCTEGDRGFSEALEVG